MNILLISNMYPDNDNPSYGIFVKKTEDMLIEGGFDVEKVVMYKTYSKLKKVLNYFNHYLKVIFKIMNGNYDIVYVHYASHNAIPILVCKVIGKKFRLYTNVHGSDIIPEKFTHNLLNFLSGLLIRASNLIIVPSSYFKELITDRYKVNCNISVFPSGGIDRTIFKKKDKKYDLFNLDPSKRYIGFVGRIDYGKGWDDLVNAFSILEKSILNNLELIIVGNGSKYNELLDLINKNNLRDKIKLVEFMNHEDLSYIYNIIDIFIFPTKREGESLGLVGLEALSCGTPVIGSEIGGIRGYLNDGENGLFFEPGNVNDLAMKIEKLINLSINEFSLMEKMSSISVEKFDKDIVNKDFLNLFKTGDYID